MLGFSDRRQNPCTLEVSATQEPRIARRRGGANSQFLQLLPGELVDEVAPRQGAVERRIDLFGQRHRDSRKRHPVEVPDRDGGVAGALDFRLTLLADPKYAHIRTGVLGPARHVLDVSVRERSSYQKPVAVARVQCGTRGEQFEAGQPRIVLSRRWSPGGDPLRQHAIFGAFDREPPAPAVGDREGRLQQHQAVGRRQRQDPARARLARQRLVVDLRRITPQGELEVVLTGRGAVAWTRVAPGLRHHREDVVAEAPHEGTRRSLDPHGGRDRAAVVKARRDPRRAIGRGMDDAGLIDPRDRRVRRIEHRLAGKIRHGPVLRARGHDQELLLGAGTGEGSLLGQEL